MARFLSHPPTARRGRTLRHRTVANRPARTEQLFRRDDKKQMHDASLSEARDRKPLKLQGFGWQRLTMIFPAVLKRIPDCPAIRLGAAWSTRKPELPGSSST